MREFLLSVASPESLTWLGFLLLAAGLLGEVAVLVEPFEKHWTQAARLRIRCNCAHRVCDRPYR
jgi:hypothetical protein